MATAASRTSSCCASVVAAALAAVLLAGCGGNGRRDAVADYVRDVDDVTVAMKAQITEVAKANQALASSHDPASLAPRLARSERTLRTLERRLRAIDPPPDAARLHRLVLRLVDRQAGLAHESATAARFLPRFSAALRPVQPAGTRLTKGLRAGTTTEAQAAALERYRRELAGPLRRLGALSAPPLLRPSLEAQEQALRGLSSSAGGLAKALREQRAADVPALVARIGRAAASTGSTAAQRAQIAAVRAYNRRVADVASLARQVQDELNRLGRTL